MGRGTGTGSRPARRRSTRDATADPYSRGVAAGTGGYAFALLFLAFYAAFHVGYFFVPDEVLREVVYRYGITTISELLLGWLAPSEGVRGDGNLLQSSRAALIVVRGCDGSGMSFLLAAAILSYRAPWARRLSGLLLGTALVFTLNHVRIIVLYFVVAYARDDFVLVHVYLLPIVLIVAVVCYFLTWARWASRERRHGDLAV